VTRGRKIAPQESRQIIPKATISVSPAPPGDCIIKEVGLNRFAVCSGKTGSPGCSPLSRTTTRSCRDKSDSAASSRSVRCKNLTLVRRSSAQRRRPAPAGRNKSRVALRPACIRGGRGRIERDRHRGGATTARERLQVGHLAMAWAHTLPSHSAKLSRHRRSTGANSRSAWSRDSTRVIYVKG
jgi:hypothetical protein